MKHVILALFIVLTTTVLCAADKNQRKGKIMKLVVKKYDANGNGKLDDDEQAVLLKKFDANGNGELEKDEKMAVAKSLKKKSDETGDESGVPPSKWNTVGFQQANTMGGGKAEIPESGVFRVFVLMGQSNMHGTARARELKAPYNKKHDRIRVWANGQWEYFVPSSKFGPGVSMAHQLAEKWPNDTIGILKISSGGTGISAFEKNWTKERADRTHDGRKGSFYKDLMNAVAEIKNISKPVYSGFVWKQGGADGNRKETAEEYYDTFAKLVSDMRKDLNAPEMPVFILTYASDEDLEKSEKLSSGKRKYLKPVLMAHNKAARDIPKTTTIHHGSDLPKEKDGVHFNHEGQMTLGKMAADAVEKFYKIK